MGGYGKSWMGVWRHAQIFQEVRKSTKSTLCQQWYASNDLYDYLLQSYLHYGLISLEEYLKELILILHMRKTWNEDTFLSIS